jgi:peroxiredoxin
VSDPWDQPGRVADIFAAGEQRWLEHWRRGPSRRAWTELPVQAGDSAPDLELLDSDGRPVWLSSLWSAQPALLLFWRHWGCGCEVGRAENLRNEYGRLTDAGARVVVIGQGESERGAWYRRAFDVPAPILVDMTGAAYRAYGLLEMSPWLLLGEPKPPMSTFESWIPEHRQKGRPVADNPFQLPGEFVINREGRLVFVYRYAYCDNYPDVDSLLDSVREAAAGA